MRRVRRALPLVGVVLLASGPPEAGWTCGRRAAPAAADTTALVTPAPLPDSLGMEEQVPLPTLPEVLPAQHPPVAVQTGPVPAADLVIPVVGIRGSQLSDTFTQSRSEGRVHNAIDIMAPKGTPVVAAAAGRVKRLFTSEKGGLTVYVLLPDGHTVHYYAHLDGYAPGLAAGQALRVGDPVGFVGETGNVVPGSPHLHFAIWTAADSLHFWDGANQNPYALLKSAPVVPMM